MSSEPSSRNSYKTVTNSKIWDALHSLIVTIHEGGRGRIGFPTKCGGINRGDIPRVPQAPRDVPEVDPDTRGQEKPYKHEHGRLYCHYFCRMDNHPMGWPHLYKDTPKGCFVYTVSNDLCMSDTEYVTGISTASMASPLSRHEPKRQREYRCARLQWHPRDKEKLSL